MNGLCRRLVLAGLILAGAELCLADGVIRDGLGARSGGRGGTNLAFEDNGEILLDNPASMGRVDGNGLAEVGFDMLFPDLTYRDTDNAQTRSWDNPFPAGQASYIRRSKDGCWAYGLGAYSVAGFGANYQLNGPASFPGPQKYHSLGMFIKVLPGISYNVTDKFSVGATFGLGLSHAELAGPWTVQGGPFTGLPTRMNLQATGAVPTWSVGMRYDIDDCTSLGATYTSVTHFRMEGPASVEVPALGGSSAFDAHVKMVWPQSLGLGVKHKLCEHRIISADVIWYDWSSAFNQFDLSYTNFSNPVFAGATGGTLNDVYPLHWRDSVSIRLGHECMLDDDHVLRVGYIYHRNPIPSETLTPWLQATLENAFTVGYGWNYSKCTSFDLGYQYSFGPGSVSVADSSFVGGDFNNSTSTSQVHWLYASVIQKF